MSEYVTLLGAEQVQSAGSAMRSAADEMQRAASTIDQAVDRLCRAFDEAAQRAHADSEPLGVAVEWETLDGLHRTTDKAMAENWAPHVGVRVVRRAPGGGA